MRPGLNYENKNNPGISEERVDELNRENPDCGRICLFVQIPIYYFNTCVLFLCRQTIGHNRPKRVADVIQKKYRDKTLILIFSCDITKARIQA